MARPIKETTVIKEGRKAAKKVYEKFKAIALFAL